MTHLQADQASKQGATDPPPKLTGPPTSGDCGDWGPSLRCGSWGQNQTHLPTDLFWELLMDPIQQQLSLLQQLLLANEERLEPFIEFTFVDLRQIFQQILVIADQRLGCF